MKTIFTSFVLLMLSCLGAQSRSEVSGNFAEFQYQTYTNTLDKTISSPQAASMGRYGHYPVDLYTGNVDISIPVYTVAGKNINMPITLKYNSSGVRVRDLPSWVGAGWNLQVAGVITRQVKGKVDTYGNYYSRAESDIAKLSSLKWNDYFADYYALQQGATLKANLDTQPDEFSYTFPGGGGSFYLKPSAMTDPTKGILMEKSMDYKILPVFKSSTDAEIVKFTIIDNNGNKYIYTSYESTESYMERSDAGGLGGSPGMKLTYRSAWYLTSMESADGSDKFSILYTTKPTAFKIPIHVKDGDAISYPDKSSQISGPFEECASYNIKNFCGEFPEIVHGGVLSTTILERKVLSSIEYRRDGALDTKVTFTAEEFTESGGFKIDKLQKIEVFRGNNISVSSTASKFKTFVFNYATTVSASIGRLTLKEFKEDSGDSSINPPAYKFTYEGSLPDILSTAIDFWGFYNSNTNTTSLVPDYTDSKGVVYKYINNTANRWTDPIKTKNGSLKRIDYPTGGYTTFEFEAHMVKKIFGTGTSTGDSRVGGLRIKQINSYASTQLAFSKTYTYNKPNSTESSGILLKDFRYVSESTYHINPLSAAWTGADPALACDVYCRRVIVFSDNSSLQPTGDNRHVGYSFVTEKFNGSQEFEFRNTAGTFPANGELKKTTIRSDKNVIVKTIEYKYSSDVGETRRNDEIKAVTVTPRQEQDNRDRLCLTSGNQFGGWLLPNGSSGQCSRVIPFQNGYDNSKYDVVPYKVSTYWPYTKSKTETEFFQQDGKTAQAVTITDMSYEDKLVSSPTTVIFSNKEKALIKYGIVYPTRAEASGNMTKAVIDDLVKRNIVTVPILTRRYSGTVVIDGARQLYKLYTGFPKLEKIERYEASWDASGKLLTASPDYGWKTGVSDIKYDAYYNMTEYTPVEQLPVKYSYINGYLSSNSTGTFTTSYSYGEFKQLLSVTQPDGQKTYFTYDKLWRLKQSMGRPKTSSASPENPQGFNVLATITYKYNGGDIYRNYIDSKSYYTPTTGSELVLEQTRQWLDGLGRPVETIKVGYTPNKLDLITYQTYDNYDRLVASFHPFESAQKDGTFTLPPAKTDKSSTVLDGPLDRVSEKLLSQGWYATRFYYKTNTSAVSFGGVQYNAGTLSVNETVDPTDSSWKIIEYTDLAGKVVCSRRSNGTENLDTRYLYDAKQRLTYILPPGVSTASSTLSFKYLYDGRDNVTAKYIPDQGWTYTMYNRRNIATYQQDPSMKANSKWIRHEYDAYGREIRSGFVSQTVANGLSLVPFTEILTETTYDGTKAIEKGKMTSQKTKVLESSPVTSLTKTFTYDAYGRLVKTNENNFVGGSETVTLTYDWADNVLSETHSHNRSESSVTVYRRYTYDHSGRRDKSYMKVTRNGSDTEPEVLVSDMDYTIKDELKTLNLGKHSGKSAFLQEVNYGYNQLGWLTSINGGDLGDGNTSTTFCAPTFPVLAPGSGVSGRDLFALKLYYNDPSANSTYAQPMKNGNIAQMNWQVRGRNIQAYGFKYDFAGRLKSSRYGEMKPVIVTRPPTISTSLSDQAAPIASSPAGTSSSDGIIIGTPVLYKTYSYKGSYDTDYSYDSRGNFTTLNRRGKAASDCTVSDVIDQLSYAYSTNTNRISTVTEQSKAGTTVSARGFGGTSSYTYDVNGNVRTDSKKGLTLTYNHLNLPKSIVRSSKTITSIYTADGRKLKTSGGSDSREYFEGIEYVNGKLTSVYFEDGRIYFTSTTATSGRYEYTLRDHLGNSRVTFADLNEDGLITETTSASTNELLSEQHYYPFGMEMEGPWVTHSGVADKYRYNGKELNPDVGLYDYGARNYDPAIGRWLQVDPAAELMPGWSPYNYTFNNPIAFIDPDGTIPYPITIRAFAPFNSFGGGFHGDGANRGFTTSSEVTARMHQVINFDSDKSSISSTGWSDATTHPILGTATADASSTVSRFDSYSSSTSREFNFGAEVASANPLVPGSPDIDVKSAFQISSTDSELTITGDLTGDNFPSTEAFISDPTGQNIFLGVGMYDGNPLTSLPGDNDREITSFSISISLDDQGNFTGVNMNGTNYSIADWNNLFATQDPHDGQ